MKNPSSLLNNGFTLLGAGRKNDDWFLKRCSVRPAHKWRTQPVGGEVRAEVWPCLFDEPGCAPKGQEFDRCVAVTHVSWLCNEGVLRGRIQGAARNRARAKH